MKLLERLKSRLKGKPVIAVLRLDGVIGGGRGLVGRPGLNHAALSPLIEAAFKAKRVKAVALAINSPGGAPAQSAMIARHIRRLSAEKSIPVYAFCEDVAASGGYMLACAAKEIYADEHSITGSIGVISAGFGFQRALERLGVERRLYTAGGSKALLDPFSEERPEDVARLKHIQGKIHERFIALVKESRGARLDPEAPLFNGDVWVGEEAAKLGIIDGIAHLRPHMQKLYGEDAQFRQFKPRKGLLARFGVGAFADEAMEALETRALRARYGL